MCCRLAAVIEHALMQLQTNTGSKLMITLMRSSAWLQTQGRLTTVPSVLTARQCQSTFHASCCSHCSLSPWREQGQTLRWGEGA